MALLKGGQGGRASKQQFKNSFNFKNALSGILTFSELYLMVNQMHEMETVTLSFLSLNNSSVF